MAHDLAWICNDADALVRLKGSVNSKGAAAEQALAQALGLPVYRQTATGSFSWGGYIPHSRNQGRVQGRTLKRYGAILADPPWQFNAYSGPRLAQRSEHQHYDISPLDVTAAVNVPAADDCAMFMWVVDSHLDQGIELLKRWGFTFKTVAFVWVKTCKSDPTKPRMGMGLWTRKESELCILGTRGSVPRRDKGVRQVVMAPRREHSRKPDEIYSRIERLVDGPYLEMYARQRWPGWDAVGNETEKFS